MSQRVPQHMPLSTRVHLQNFISVSPWSGLCDIIDIGRSLGLLEVILLLLCVMEILQRWMELQHWPFHEPQPFTDDKDSSVVPFRALDLGLGGG